MQKVVLLVDDEQFLLEALEVALSSEGYRVLKAPDVSTALDLLKRERVDLISIDVMLSPGRGLEGTVNPQTAGIYLCQYVAQHFPHLHAFCLSVVSDLETIRTIEKYGVRFLRKGETPLRTVLNLMRSCLTGVAYSTERRLRG